MNQMKFVSRRINSVVESRGPGCVVIFCIGLQVVVSVRVVEVGGGGASQATFGCGGGRPKISGVSHSR